MKDGRTMENCLFCDLETPQEFIDFFESGRAHETGVIAHALCPDIANLYRRVEQLESEILAMREDAKSSWNQACDANGQMEAFRILGAMVDRVGYERKEAKP